MGGVRETHWEGVGPGLTTMGVFTVPEPEGRQGELQGGEGAPQGFWLLGEGAPAPQTLGRETGR